MVSKRRVCLACHKVHKTDLQPRHFPRFQMYKKQAVIRFLNKHKCLWDLAFPKKWSFSDRIYLIPDVRCMVERYRKQFDYSSKTAICDLWWRLEKCYRYDVARPRTEVEEGT